MNREILFKGQRKSDREWIYGNLLRTDDGIFVIQNHVPYHLLEKYEVLGNTVCEYTGMTDKDGNKIFENDIMECIDSQFKGVVQFGLYDSQHYGFFIKWKGNCLFRKDISYWAENKLASVCNNIFTI